MNRRLAVVALAGCLSGCGPDPAQMDRLAALGKIDDSAPVQAEAEIIIHAAPEKIWKLLTDIDGWPTWQQNVANAAIHGQPRQNTEFTWHSGGVDIASTIRQYEPDAALAWTGHALFIGAIHTWTLKPFSDGRTVVHTRESMAGPFIGVFYSSLKLLESDQQWLLSLKKAAEG